MDGETKYYLEQVGGSLPAYAGVRFQRGHGIFGRLISGIGGFMRSLLPAAGMRAAPSGVGLLQDILAGKNVLESAKNRFVEAGKNVADETLEQLKTRIGRGRKRRKSNKRKDAKRRRLK